MKEKGSPKYTPWHFHLFAIRNIKPLPDGERVSEIRDWKWTGLLEVDFSNQAGRSMSHSYYAGVLR